MDELLVSKTELVIFVQLLSSLNLLFFKWFHFCFNFWKQIPLSFLFNQRDIELLVGTFVDFSLCLFKQVNSDKIFWFKLQIRWFLFLICSLLSCQLVSKEYNFSIELFHEGLNHISKHILSSFLSIDFRHLDELFDALFLLFSLTLVMIFSTCGAKEIFVYWVDLV